MSIAAILADLVVMIVPFHDAGHPRFARRGWLTLTSYGRRALAGHLAELRRIAALTTETAG